MKTIFTFLLSFSIMTGTACGDESPASDGGPGDSEAARDSAVGRDSAPRDATVIDDCTDEANKKVWVLTTDLDAATRESHLVRFDPELLTYTDVGEIQCELEGTNLLHSMAVDRRGTAWVSSSLGALYRVDTTTAACVATGMETGQEQVRNYGMGFATVGDTTEERLFITAEGGWWMDGLAYRRLGAIHTSTLDLSIIGDIDAPTPAYMELTGTGDGRLFGMVLDVRNIRDIIVSIELLDAATGGTLERKLATVEVQGGFAFAQWGGDFWLFTEAPDESARVIQFDFDAGTVVQTVDTVLDVPGTIVGAGVSTCAPYDLI
ncbi:MAG: hypothetical protein JRH11_06490 [Deltaproteobacteria bacterium]|nr:hypothetical protein [Deltaproteobacteria bacterium]